MLPNLGSGLPCPTGASDLKLNSCTIKRNIRLIESGFETRENPVSDSVKRDITYDVTVVSLPRIMLFTAKRPFDLPSKPETISL